VLAASWVSPSSASVAVLASVAASVSIAAVASGVPSGCAGRGGRPRVNVMADAGVGEA
jgi:hypothetical protein